MKISVRVKPRSRSNDIMQISENYFEVKVTSPPEKGKANEKVIELLSKELCIPKSKLHIVSGMNSRNKIIEITE